VEAGGLFHYSGLIGIDFTEGLGVNLISGRSLLSGVRDDDTLYQEAVQLPNCKVSVDTKSLGLEFPYLILVKLMRRPVLVDEVIVDFGWKRFRK
jgi:hypothetical protein